MLTEETWEKTLIEAWRCVRDRVEVKRDLEFAHEHTLQFHFAWEVGRLLSFSERFGVRFEVLSGKDAHGETIRTDLVLWTEPKFKIAVEMKAPIRSEGGSNSAMTSTRMAFYRDLDRLRHLAETARDGIRRGMFLAVVNERGYVIEGRQKVNAVYATYHGTQLAPRMRIPACPGPNGCDYELVMPANQIAWDWRAKTQAGSVIPAHGMKHFWLEPIPVYPAVPQTSSRNLRTR